MGGGYNTDVLFNRVRYHIQTEDQGAFYGELVSHIYERGTILLTIRRFYGNRHPDETLGDWIRGMTAKQHKDILKVLARGGLALVRAYGLRYADQVAEPARSLSAARASNSTVHPALAPKRKLTL